MEKQPSLRNKGSFLFWKKFIWLILLFSMADSRLLQAQTKLLCAAESSNYTATSTYDDVMKFIRGLKKLSPYVRTETIAVSTEGREIPLMIIGRPLPLTPAALKNDPRIAVYIQANIHAGEVEGKEASLMLARDILTDPKLPYLDKLVILIAPIFNADGNEKISPKNRPSQVGPEKGVGVRHNGQNLDLNRDAMKLESPELKGLVQNVLLRWDPVLLVDCHTTDGSYHEEPVTYSWPLCPNGDQTILAYMRDKMLPAIDTELEKKYGILSIPYGDPRDFRDLEKGWQTFSHQPRFVTNYIGLRNRLAILNENYNYADFKTRVTGCYFFLKSILNYCESRSQEIAKLVTDADRKTTQRGLAPAATDLFGLDIEVKPTPNKVTILGYEVEIIPREGSPFPQMKKTDRKKTYVLTYYADFVPKRTVRIPYAYLIPVSDQAMLDKLLDHGIVVEKLDESLTCDVEAFEIKELKPAERLYQGHRTNQVSGEYKISTVEFPQGTLVVRMAQPLGNLAAYLLEPESDDGLLVWNFFDRHIVSQWGRGFQTYPVYKLYLPHNLILRSLK